MPPNGKKWILEIFALRFLALPDFSSPNISVGS